MAEALFTPEEERDLLAAEYVVRLLDGAEHAKAERRLAQDADFRARVDAWAERLQPLLDGVPAEAPHARVWEAIREHLADRDGVDDKVVQLRRRLAIWRGYAAAITAVAAALALTVGIERGRPPTIVREPARPQPAQPALVAALAPETGPTGLIATFDRASSSLIIAPAVLDEQGGRDFELWVVPADGDPRSLGVIPVDEPRRIAISPALLGELRSDVTLAVSVEPAGGSPTGLPTGPIVASGTLRPI